MSSPSTLLTDAPQGRHFCQLHESSAALVTAISAFAEAGLRRDEVVILVMSSRKTAVLDALRTAGLDPVAAQASAQLVVVDGAGLLERFMTRGMPEWERFRHAVGGILDVAIPDGTKRVRVYGEMVDDLWRAGNTPAAIRLEEYWNRIAHDYRFCLFCGYEIGGMSTLSADSPVHEIGRTHSDVLSTESDERLLQALDAASRDVLGLPVSNLISHTAYREQTGEHRLPLARRTILWLQRNMPSAKTKILQRAHHYYKP